MERRVIFDKIQKELCDRMIPFCDQLKAPYTNAQGFEKISAMAANLERNTETFNNEWTNTLNLLVHENNLKFSGENEKREFLDFIKPTNVEILKYFAKP
jgi:hypothetical protein